MQDGVLEDGLGEKVAAHESVETFAGLIMRDQECRARNGLQDVDEEAEKIAVR